MRCHAASGGQGEIRTPVGFPSGLQPDAVGHLATYPQLIHLSMFYPCKARDVVGVGI